MKTFLQGLCLGLMLLGVPAGAQEAPATSPATTTTLEEVLAAGVLSLSDDNLDDAAALFAAAQQAHPDDPRPWLGTSRVAERRNQLLPAIEAARQAYRVAPDDPDVHMELARLLTRLGTVAEALDIYRRVREIDPQRADAYLLPALILRDVGDDDSAARLLEAAIRAGLAPPRLVEELGLRYLALGHDDKALALGNKMIQMYETRPLSYLLAGLAMRAIGEQEAAARKMLLRAIELGVPDPGRAHLEIGSSLLETGAADEALKHLESAAEDLPDLPEVHYRLATAYRDIGDDTRADRALARFQELSQAQDARQADDKIRGTALNAIQALATENRLSEARDQLATLLEQSPKDHRALALMAKIQFSIGEMEAADQSIRQARELAPEQVEYHFLEGYFASQTGQIETAREALGRALAMDDSLTQAHSLMAFLEADAARYGEAAEHFERALALQQTDGSFGQRAVDALRQRYAEVLDALERPAEAEAQRRALSQPPDDPSPTP